jgi:hypothetical protein
MNTTENNKIIAEFMGGQYTYGSTGVQMAEGLIYIPQIGGLEIKNIKYHSDWNWLMEVVEKIESLEYLNKKSTCEGFDSFGIEINKNRCDITHYGDFTHHLFQGNGKTRIESTYNACVEFIKWYNKQK